MHHLTFLRFKYVILIQETYFLHKVNARYLAHALLTEFSFVNT